MSDRIASVSARGALRWDSGHPWIFRSDVVQAPAGPAGLVRVTGPRGRPLGTALYSPLSEISLRMLDREAIVDERWWRTRVERAVSRREPIAAEASAYRLVHAEGDGLPSFVCDRYADWLVVQSQSAGIETVCDVLVDELLQRTGARGVLARNDAPVRAREGLAREVVLLRGAVPETIEVEEHGVRYLAAPRTGQKTGAFLDQRENRLMMGGLAGGRALDCFSYHGSFALHMARRAGTVLALDSSGAALERARANAAFNGIANVETRQGDVTDSLRAWELAGEKFDTIVVDPPAFARNRASLGGAVRGYHELNLRAMRLLAPGGLLFTASCSYHLTRAHFLEMLEGAAQDAGRPLVLRGLQGQPLDHPEVLTIPETGYLKSALIEARD